MIKFSKRHSITLFVSFLIALPIFIQAATPPLRVCGGIIFLEEDDASTATEEVTP